MVKLTNVTDLRTGKFHSTVVVKESQVNHFSTPEEEPETVVANNSENSSQVQAQQSSTNYAELEQRISDLEDAVVELAGIVTEVTE